MTKFCEDCEWWEFTYQNADKKFGKCSNLFVEENVRVIQDEENIDDPTVLTEATFGCIYWEKGDKAVVKIKP